MTVKNPPVRQVIASPRRAGGTKHYHHQSGRRHQGRIALVNTPLPKRWLQGITATSIMRG